MPNNENILLARSLCRYATGDTSGASSDWERIKVLSQRKRNFNFIYGIPKQAKGMNGYEEMMQAFNLKQQETAGTY